MSYTVPEFIDKIDLLLQEDNLELAEKFCKKACEIYPDNAQLLERYAILKLEVGCMGEALELLNFCVSIEPNSGATKYLYLGQLKSGLEALQNYEKGALILESELSQIIQEDLKEEKLMQLSNVYCSMAEICISDDIGMNEEEAEAKSIELLSKSLQIYQYNSDALLILSGIKLAQGNTEESKEYITKSLSWLPDYPDTAFIPSYDNRKIAAKTLFELQLFELALDVLATIQDENDEDVELWNLLGLTYFETQDFEASKECFEHALKLMKMLNDDDGELMAFMQQKIEACNIED